MGISNIIQMNIEKVQKLLKEYKIDGWLLYDFRGKNSLACRFLEIPESTLLTRRFFYWIPQAGDPVKLVSTVENPLTHLVGVERKFRSWQELESCLQEILQNASRVAMEYSPYGAVPEISLVDGGTIDLIRKAGPEVVSSGDLLLELSNAWDDAKWKSQQEAAEILETIVKETREWIRLHLKDPISEYDVQQFMLNQMHAGDCITNHPPICAVNANSSDPHYAPEKGKSSEIKEGDWILLDLWCKKNTPGAVYADITRMGVIGDKVGAKHQVIFDVVKEAQKNALAFVKERYEKKQPLYGYEVDRVARKVITDAGYGDFFLHRTGHNIDEQDHGPGAHIDDLETHDTRKLLPGTCFSIEPGIYLKGEFGVRLEYDVYLHPEGQVIVTGGIQDEIHQFL